jgi:hypothetical protein
VVGVVRIHTISLKIILHKETLQIKNQNAVRVSAYPHYATDIWNDDLNCCVVKQINNIHNPS